MPKPIRICFLGDSFTQGAGDPERRGWVGRVLEKGPAGYGVTGFNLGVRGNTSEDSARRWQREAETREDTAADNRLVLSFGTNDALEVDGRTRVSHDDTLATLAILLLSCRQRRTPALVMGPPPVTDAGDRQ